MGQLGWLTDNLKACTAFRKNVNPQLRHIYSWRCFKSLSHFILKLFCRNKLYGTFLLLTLNSDISPYPCTKLKILLKTMGKLFYNVSDKLLKQQKLTDESLMIYLTP